MNCMSAKFAVDSSVVI